jgi:Leucine-rich repeat (LRR) protein
LLALASAQESTFLPAGFCPAPTPSTGISWDPPSAGGIYATGGIATPGPLTPFADLAAFQALDQSSITLLYLSNAGINSITGLNTLPNLQTLCLSTNNLTGVNLSGCTALVNFFCGVNALTSLDVSTSDNLLNLFAGSNQLTVASVNTILSALVSNGQTGGNVDVSSQAPAAPPSHGPPDGIAAEATLLGETPAWAVNTD